MGIKKKVDPKKVATKIVKRVEPEPKVAPVIVPQPMTKSQPAAAVYREVTKTDRRPVEWRKRQGHDAWHWIPQCSNWPTENFRARTEAPTTGEKCDECLSKEARRGDS